MGATGGGNVQSPLPGLQGIGNGIQYEADWMLNQLKQGRFPIGGPPPRVMLNAMKISSGMHIPQGPINTMLQAGPSAVLSNDSPLVQAFSPNQQVKGMQPSTPQYTAPTPAPTMQTTTPSMQTPTPAAQAPAVANPVSTSSSNPTGYLSGGSTGVGQNTKTGIGNQGIV